MVGASPQLSSHFSVAEIFGSVAPNPGQRYLGERLCHDLLEPIRALVGEPLRITDGLRTWARWEDLEARGYNPSRDSDHSFLLDWNPHGVGAADIVRLVRVASGRTVARSFTERQFQLIVEKLSGPSPIDPPWGQLIWYRKKGHIHVSNRRSVWYAPAALSALALRVQRRTYIQEG